MYREDLDQLLDLFQSKCARVTISDKRYRYESFDEMKAQKGPRIDHLEIHGEQPGLHFVLNKSEQSKTSPPSTLVFNELRAEEATNEADALFFRIKDFLSDYQRPYVRWIFVVLAMVSVIGLVVFMSRHLNTSPPVPAPGPRNEAVSWSLQFEFLGWIAATVGFPILAVASIGNYLSLETRLNSPSFWVRNREDFSKHAVSAAIGAVVGGVVGWLAGHFLK